MIYALGCNCGPMIVPKIKQKCDGNIHILIQQNLFIGGE